MFILRMKRAGALAALLWATALAPAGAVPPGFNIQGRLTDADGVNREGNYSIKFTLYDAATVGTALWIRTYTALTVRNGNFQTVLGDVAGQPMLSDVFASGDTRHLEIQVLFGPGVSSPEQPLVPRQQLVSVPYALRAQTLENASILKSTTTVTLSASGQERVHIAASGNVGVGTSSPLAHLEVSGQGGGGNARNMVLSNNSPADTTTRFIDFIRSTVDSEFIVYNNGDVRADGAFSGPADYAEFFHSDDATLKPGELVCLTGSNNVGRCTEGGTLIGVVSTKPGVLGIYADDITDAAEIYEKDPHWVKVGLLGQVPTKVSVSQGAILPGDQLTLGNDGVAVKGLSPRTLLIIALENAGADGKIRALIK